jgi:hypothetical protein
MRPVGRWRGTAVSLGLAGSVWRTEFIEEVVVALWGRGPDECANSHLGFLMNMRFHPETKLIMLVDRARAGRLGNDLLDH